MSWCSLILKLRTSVRFCEGLLVENSQLLSKEVRAKESTVVMVTCLAGFSLIGSEEVSCQTYGTWTTVPTCHKRGESLDCRAKDIHDYLWVVHILRNQFLEHFYPPPPPPPPPSVISFTHSYCVKITLA